MGAEGSSFSSLTRKDSSSSRHTPNSYNSDETESGSDITWSPGDGICPTTAQFNYCCKSKLDDWTSAASLHQENSDTFQFYIKALLDLVKDVPPFFHYPPEGISITGQPRSFLVLRSSLQIKTTGDSTCSQSQKYIDYLQCIGSPVPVTYRTKAQTELHVAIPISGKPLRAGLFTNIVLAWSYIISCRWVEVLQQAGEESQIIRDQDTQVEEHFWNTVTQGLWVAQVKRHKGVYYSPWMLRSSANPKRQHNWVPVSSNSSVAFEMLLSFCISERLEGELLTGLTSVLMLVSRNAPSPKLSPPIMISAPPLSRPRQDDTIFHKLYQSIDKFIFLSSTQDALDSLLCSAFFDPCVPCNQIGASSLGIKKAISTNDEIDDQLLLKAITYTRPHLSLLWAAVVCTEQAPSFLNIALENLPPICLPAGFWTNTTQSFLQTKYHDNTLKASVIPRAAEFQTSYFCRPDISVPWSPAPPFGTTPISNLSLEVREHLAHAHSPISWAIYWVLNSGGKIQASSQHQLEPGQVDSIFCTDAVGHINDLTDSERNIAEEQSWNATSRLFNWHRSYDDGIWLDDGQGDVEFIRRLQLHPWIVDQFNNEDNDPIEEPKHRELCVEAIAQWIFEVEKHRQPLGRKRKYPTI